MVGVRVGVWNGCASNAAYILITPGRLPIDICLQETATA